VVGSQAAGLLAVGMAATDSALAPRTLPPPRLAEGTELIGQYRGSGFTEPRYLACRGDGQVVQLSELVYLLATLVDGRRDLDELTQVFGTEIDRTVTTEQVEFLLDNKLRPPGLVASDIGQAARTPTSPDPLLMLKYRTRLVPEPIVWAIAGVFRPLFAAPVVTLALVAFVVVDALVLAGGGSAQILSAARAFSAQPALTLPVLAVILVVGGLHECGHAAACRYGGARPGVMGIGLYLVWPAFYSTVTDAYRLNRAGRLRVDLGGVYFNAVSMTVIGMAYLITGSPWLLVALVALHIETMWQFLPSVRLDGYYILADLVGVPDLFARLGPTLRSALPWRETHPRVAELTPSARRIITFWAALTTLFLGSWIVVFVLLAPQILLVVSAALPGHLEAVATAVQAGHVAAAAVGAVQLILLVLPYAGLTLITVNLGHTLCHTIRTRPRHRRRARQR
jgi:putative peptide zinc metalloprotease protein